MNTNNPNVARACDQADETCALTSPECCVNCYAGGPCTCDAGKTQVAQPGEREAFEAHFARKFGTKPLTWREAEGGPYNVPEGKLDSYYVRSTQDAWEFWQARAALPASVPEQAGAVAWQPLSTAPEGARVLLGPRNAPVVGIVRHMPEWADEQESVASVIHYNGVTLVAGYHCSEWHPLPFAAPGAAVAAREQEVPDDLKLTLLMAPYHLNLVVGHDRAQLLAFGRDVWAAAKRGDSPTIRTRNIAEVNAAAAVGAEGKEVQHGTATSSAAGKTAAPVKPEGRDSVTNAHALASREESPAASTAAVAPCNGVGILRAMLAARPDLAGVISPAIAALADSSPVASSTDAEGAQQIADAVQAGWNACVRNVFSLADQTGDETADKSSDFERGRRFEAKGIARAMNGFGPEHCDDLHRFFTTPAPSQQREKAHEGPLVGDQIPADQHAAQSERQSWWTDSIVGDGLEGSPPPPPSASQFLQRADARWEEKGRLLGRAFSAFGDVLGDIGDWKDKALAEAVEEVRAGVLRVSMTDKPSNMCADAHLASHQAVKTDAAPAVDAGERESAWISVAERLPGEQGQDSEEVMCFLSGHCAMMDFECRDGAGWGIRLGYYDAEKGMFRTHGRPDPSVTHWMPLPTPPASGETA